MNIRGILTDFDGVLLDSFREGLRRIKLVCALHDRPFGRETRKELFNRWGLPGIELLMQCLGVNETLARRMYIDWERLDKADPPPLVPGAREVLVWLRQNGFKVALITSRHRANLLEVLDQLDLEREFAVVTAKEDVPGYHKPDPRVFRHALEALEAQCGILAKQCIFVGDTPSDTVAGHNAELETLIVQTGPYMLEHIERYPVALGNVLKSIDDLPYWIERRHDGPLKILYG
ncbi:HAD-IA family hydrolase [Candidatus Kaiserbacteria bacterium]|nr:HAD-IA family hydrolase [Candidatus Kaiserbacteria bacterium]